MLNLLRRKILHKAYEHRSGGRMIFAGLRNELKSACHAARPRPPVDFVIFAQWRKGSIQLISMLDTHSQITCRDKILEAP